MVVIAWVDGIVLVGYRSPSFLTVRLTLCRQRGLVLLSVLLLTL